MWSFQTNRLRGCLAIPEKTLMTKEEYKQQFSSDDAVGWLAIDKALDNLYPNQEPKHYGTIVKYMLGGKEPLDGL